MVISRWLAPALAMAACGRPAIPPLAEPATPAIACSLHAPRSDFTFPPDVEVRDVETTYAYDAGGRLIWAQDQPDIWSRRRSWFTYDNAGRLEHVVRWTDRALEPPLVNPLCDDAPCPWRQMDFDVVEEDFARGFERRIAYEHVDGRRTAVHGTRLFTLEGGQRVAREVAVEPLQEDAGAAVRVPSGLGVSTDAPLGCGAARH